VAFAQRFQASQAALQIKKPCSIENQQERVATITARGTRADVAGEDGVRGEAEEDGVGGEAGAEAPLRWPKRAQHDDGGGG
jgi:hypothetical protein